MYIFAHMCDYLSGEVLELELLDQSVSTFLRSLILRDRLPSRKFVHIKPTVSDSQSLFSVASLFTPFTVSLQKLLNPAYKLFLSGIMLWGLYFKAHHKI